MKNGNETMKQTRSTGLSNSTSEQRGVVNMTRKPSPSIHSNYNMPTKHANAVPHVSKSCNFINFKFKTDI